MSVIKPLAAVSWAEADMDDACLGGSSLSELNWELRSKPAEPLLVPHDPDGKMGRMAESVAHHINNINSVILGNAELIAELVPESAVAHESAQRIVESVDRATRIVRRLLQFSGRLPCQLGEHDLNRLITELMPELQAKMPANVTLQFLPGPDLPGVSLDPDLVRDCLLELLENAGRAAEAGDSVTLETEADTGRERPWSNRAHPSQLAPPVKLTVRDTGRGMNRLSLARAFDPFFTTSTDLQIPGLGLSAVQGMIQTMGGAVSLAPNEPAGTAVCLALNPAGPTLKTPKLKGVSRNRTTAGTTLLIVDDDPAYRVAIGEILRSRGYQVLEADRGETALEISKRSAVDMVFTDVHMPGMKGHTLAAALLEQDPNLPVVLVSGLDQETLAVQGKLIRGAQVLVKPFEVVDLLNMVEETLFSRKEDRP